MPAAKTVQEGQTTPKPPVPAAPKQNRGLSPQARTAKPPGSDQPQNGNVKQKAPKAPPPVFNKDASTIESAIAEKNLAELKSTKTTPSAASKPVKPANGKLLPPMARQRTNESVESKGTDADSPRSPLRRPEPAAVVAAPEDSNVGTTNPVKNTESKTNAGAPPDIQRSATAGSSIPSAIEFDPLKSAVPNDLGVSLDLNGRASPIDTQSISSMNGMGFTNADVGLGGNIGFQVQPQPYPQSFDGPATVVPVVGIAQATGLMGYQQPNGTFQQATMMPLAQQNGSMPSNMSVPSNLSALQQPFLQVSDQQSIQSMPMAELSQPMLLINPQHVRGLSMHDFSLSEAMQQQQQQMSNLPEMARAPVRPPHHARASSMQMNMSSSWNQNTQQWTSAAAAAGGGGGMGQQQQQPPASSQPSTAAPPDPFDELVTRRPVSMSAMSAPGK